jgi:magnesium chelatase family protein
MALHPVADAVLEAVRANRSVLLVGPPGLGATLIARRIPAALPPLSGDEIAEVGWRHIAAGLIEAPITARPFRAPHHTISWAAMAGTRGPGVCGACRGLCPADCPCVAAWRRKEPPLPQRLRPGELHLAHGGVLLLDEVPEFPRAVLNLVFATHARARLDGYPCRFALIGTALPCPCGWHGSELRACTCAAWMIARYNQRGWDRFDVRIPLPATVRS